MGDLTKNFSRHEFACQCGCGFDTVDYELIIVVQDIRDYIEKKLRINSGCRCPKHNSKIKGASENSLHMVAKAADISAWSLLDNKTIIMDIVDYFNRKYPEKYGLIVYENRLHIDVRKEKYRKCKIYKGGGVK